MKTFVLFAALFAAVPALAQPNGTAARAPVFSSQLPAATTGAIGGVQVGSNITVNTGVISLTSGNVAGALGYTPLRPSNNLSDVASASTARVSLGLGDIATQNAASMPSLTITGTLTAPTVAIGTITAPSTGAPLVSLTTSGISNATRLFYHSVNGELILQSNQAGLNTAMAENLNTTGYAAWGMRGPDLAYPSTTPYVNGSYEHGALFYGPSLSTNGRPGQTGIEFSRYPQATGPRIASVPPTTGVLVQTGGVFLSPYYKNIITTLGSSSITLNGGGNFPSDVNGMAISEQGDLYGVVSPGTTIVSGQGTPTLVMSAPALVSNGFEPMLIGALTWVQDAAMVLRERTFIDFYSWANGDESNPVSPFLRLDRIQGRVGAGNFATVQSPYVSLDVIGQGAFGSETNNAVRNTTSANGSINIIDPGTHGFQWHKTSVGDFHLDWNATPSRLDFADATNSTTSMSVLLDGTASTMIPTLRLGSLTGPTKAVAAAAPVTNTYNGVPGAAAGTPALGSEYTNTSGSAGNQNFKFFAGAWAPIELNYAVDTLPGAVGIADGGTVNLSTNGYLIVTVSGGTIAGANIVLPTSVGLVEGQVVRGIFLATITTPVWSSADGKTILGAPTTLNATAGGNVVAFKWVAALNEWVIWK